MIRSNYDSGSVAVLEPTRPNELGYRVLPAKRSVLIIDDEKDVIDLLRYNLERESLEVITATDDASGLEIALEHRPDLILLDQSLRIDGLKVCRQLRADPRTRGTPIIMISTLVAEIDRIIGLESGSDDYVTKPFSTRELVARIRANLRRGLINDTVDSIAHHGQLVIDPIRHEVTFDDEPIALTASEFKILAYLSNKSPRVVSRDEIIDRALGSDVSILARAIDVHISTLRRKLGKGRNQLHTVRGFGYKLTDTALTPAGKTCLASA